MELNARQLLDASQLLGGGGDVKPSRALTLEEGEEKRSGQGIQVDLRDEICESAKKSMDGSEMTTGGFGGAKAC